MYNIILSFSRNLANLRISAPALLDNLCDFVNIGNGFDFLCKVDFLAHGEECDGVYLL
jgi:hypothetical protein